MASSLWKIRYGGVTKTAEAWGAVGLELSRRNMAADQLVFRCPRQNIFDACPFAYDQPLVLLRGSTTYFSGRVQPPTASVDGESGRESWTITVAGPWAMLERIVYQQRRTLKTEDFSGLLMRYTPQVVLGQDAWGRKSTTDATIADIAAYALTQMSGIFIVSALADGITPPLTEAANLTCAAAIRRQLEWTPDAATWFNYATTPAPTLVIQRRAAMSALAIDLDDKRLTGLSSLRRRDDLVPAGVVFTFNGLELNALDSTWYPRAFDDTAGAVAGVDVIFAAFTLANQGTDQAEAVPYGLAAAYYASLATAFWEGQLAHVDESGECTGFARPGQLLNLLNGNPDWSAMAAQINSVTEDIDRGITTITLGLPPILSAYDFRDLMSKAQNSKAASDDTAKRHNGTEGVPAENGGPGGAPDVSPGDRTGNGGAGSSSQITGAGNSTFTAEFCVDGQPVKKTVIGA